MLQHEFLRLEKLRDHALSRSALPLSRAIPAGFSWRSRSRDDPAHDRAHRLPLGRGRRPVNATSGGSPPLLGTPRIDGWLIHHLAPHIRRRSTGRRSCKQDTIAINQGFSNQFEPKCKRKEVRCTLESVCAIGTSSGSGGLL